MAHWKPALFLGRSSKIGLQIAIGLIDHGALFAVLHSFHDSSLAVSFSWLSFGTEKPLKLGGFFTSERHFWRPQE